MAIIIIGLTARVILLTVTSSSLARPLRLILIMAYLAIPQCPLEITLAHLDSHRNRHRPFQYQILLELNVSINVIQS